jgi:hypothetical protein
LTALTAKAALVDPAALEDGDNVIATHVPRSEIEEALTTGTTSELFLDVAREREGEREAEQRITVSWEPADLEKLLGSTTGDEVTFAFKADELARMFDEPDVEAQGLRERMAILTVAATTAAAIGAGVAGAMPADPVSESGAGGTTAAFVTDTTSSGPAAEAATGTGGAGVSHGGAESGTVSNLVTDSTSSGPQALTEEGTVSNFVTDTTSSAGSPVEGLTPAQQLAAIEGGETGTVSNLVTDTTSSGPQASTEEGTVSNLVTDTTSSAGSPVEGLTPAQQLNAIEATGDTGTVSNLVTDSTSSGPRASTEAASTGGGGQSFIDSRGGEAALAGGLMLLILGAGFVGSRQRRGPQPA